MRLIRLATVTMLLVAAAAAPARADGFFTPFIGYNFGGDSSAYCESLTTCQEKRTNFGVSFGSGGGVFGFEEDLSYAKNFFGDVPGADTSVFTLMSNVLIGVPSGPVQPYVLGGVGLIRPHVSLNPSIVGVTNNAFGYDLGLGLNVYFSHRVGVRGDVRHFKTFSDLTLPVFANSSEKLDFWRASLGLSLRF